MVRCDESGSRSALQQRAVLSRVWRLEGDARASPAADTRCGGEHHVTVWQKRRPTMRHLAIRERRERFRLTTVRGHARQCANKRAAKYDRPIGEPYAPK